MASAEPVVPPSFDWPAVQAACERYPALAEALPLFCRHQQATLDLALVLRILEERGGQAYMEASATFAGAAIKSKLRILPGPTEV